MTPTCAGRNGGAVFNNNQLGKKLATRNNLPIPWFEATRIVSRLFVREAGEVRPLYFPIQSAGKGDAYQKRVEFNPPHWRGPCPLCKCAIELTPLTGAETKKIPILVNDEEYEACRCEPQAIVACYRLLAERAQPQPA